MFSDQQEKTGFFRKILLSYYHARLIHFTANKNGAMADRYLCKMEKIGPLSTFHIAFGVRAAIIDGNKKRAEELLRQDRNYNRISDIDRAYLDASIRQSSCVVSGDKFVASPAERAAIKSRMVNERLKKFLPIPIAS